MKNGVSKSVEIAGFPIQKGQQLQTHFCQVDQCLIGVLCSIHYNGFGKTSIFCDKYMSIDSQAGRAFIGEQVRNSCIAFVTYLEQYHNFPEGHFRRFNVACLRVAKFYKQLNMQKKRLCNGVYSDHWIRTICGPEPGIIEGNNRQKISGSLFYKNYFLFDMLVPTFRYNETPYGTKFDRCPNGTSVSRGKQKREEVSPVVTTFNHQDSISSTVIPSLVCVLSRIVLMEHYNMIAMRTNTVETIILNIVKCNGIESTKTHYQ